MTSATASRTCAAASARSAASAGVVSVARSSAWRCSPAYSTKPSTRNPPRRRRRAQFESRALGEARRGGERRAQHDGQLDRPRLREAADEHGEGSPAEREDGVGVQRSAEQLEVVGHHQGHADEHERQQGDADRAHAPEPDGRGAGERDGAGRGEHRSGEAGAEGPAVELVEAVRGDADGQEEGQQRPGQAGAVHLLGEPRAERDVREMPGGVGRVQQRDDIPHAAGPQGVERDALGVTGQRGPPRRRGHRRDSSAAC